MRKIATLIVIHVFSLFIFLFLYSPFVYAQEGQMRHVLVLNSYHNGFLWTDNIVKGIESVLGPEENCVELKIEYMDSKAMKYNTQYKEKLYDLYKYKYGNKTFDLIISSDDNAFNFLLEYHEDLFPDTPIVFCGVNNLEAPNLIDPDEFTGIIELQSTKETIDLALSMHPGTRQIVFIIDYTSTGVYFWSQIQEFSKYYKDIRMTHIGKRLSLEQIEAEVSGLPDDTIVLFGPFSRDKSKYYSFTEAASRVSKASARPMYGHFVQILPYGIIGGKLLGGFYHGQVAAKMARRILMGEKVRDIPVLTEPQTQYMFNYEQLKRWGIKLSDLPEDSIVINEPFSFYKENKRLIWGAIVVIIFQTLIIICLLVYRLKRRQAEKELRQTKERYRMVAEQAGQMTYDYNIPAGQISWSGDVLAITGFTIDEFQKVGISGWEKLIHPDDRKAALAILDESMSKCSNYQVEYRFKHKDGTYLYVEDSGLFLTDKKGNAHQMLGIMKDIKKRKHAEEALRESEERFRQVVESTEEWVWEMDSSALYTYASPVVEKLLGYKAEEIVGKKYLYDLFHPEYREALKKATFELFAGKEPFFRFLNRNVHKNGHIVWLSTSGLPILDEKGKLLGYRGADIDITERKQAEEELAKHREHLEELVRERTAELEKRVSEVEQLNSAMMNLMEDLRISNRNLEITTRQLGDANKELEAFAYSVSHDLRAPLRTIDGFSKVLLDKYTDTLDEEGKHYLQRVRAGTQNMGQLIDDILNLSRIGRQPIKRETVNLEIIIREAYRSLEDERKDRKVNFAVNEFPSVIGDPHLMKIVFVNLFSNALKFTRDRETAEIEVGSKTEDEQTTFFVKDNGTGFDMKYADKLFSPFQRLHRVEEYEGTGIGLAIVQRIIIRHGGSIRVESEVDVGTAFYFSLPRS